MAPIDFSPSEIAAQTVTQGDETARRAALSSHFSLLKAALRPRGKSEIALPDRRKTMPSSWGMMEWAA
jgi:hypothetical protein